MDLHCLLSAQLNQVGLPRGEASCAQIQPLGPTSILSHSLMVVQLPGGLFDWAEEHVMPSSHTFNYLLSIYLVPDTILDTGDNSSE